MKRKPSLKGIDLEQAHEAIAELEQELANPALDDEERNALMAEMNEIKSALPKANKKQNAKVFSTPTQTKEGLTQQQCSKIETLKALQAQAENDQERDHFAQLIKHIEESANPVPRITMDMQWNETIHALNNMLERGFGFIGDRKIHKEQIDACLNIFKTFSTSKSPLIIAQPQQGKTDVCLLTIFLFIRYLNEHLSQLQEEEDDEIRYEIVYLTNIADNELLRQNKERANELYLPGWLMEHVQIIHHGNLSRYVPKDVAIRLVIDDECHIALGRDKPFHNFLKKLGITYGKPRTQWKQPSNMMVSVSATPYPQVLKTIQNPDAFEPVVLAPGDDYYSLQQMVKNQRLKPSQPLVHRTNKGLTTSQFFAERFQEFWQLCNEQGNGFMIIRATGTRAEAIISFLTQVNQGLRQASTSLEVKDFYCKSGNIGELHKCLEKQPPFPTAVIIRGSLRAGKTLPTTRHIRMWIESANSKTDTLVQSGVGRSLGHKEPNGHSKFQDTYPIYCNADQITDAIEFYDQFYEYNGTSIVPRSNWNERLEQGQGYRQVIAQTMDEVPMSVRNSAYWGRKSKVSANNEKDLARYILMGHKPTGKAPVIVVDGPNPKHKATWDELIKAYPGIQGCVVYYEKDESAPITDPTKENSLLRD